MAAANARPTPRRWLAPLAIGALAALVPMACAHHRKAGDRPPEGRDGSVVPASYESPATEVSALPQADQTAGSGLVTTSGNPAPGQRVEPNRCGLSIAVLSRPAGDPALGPKLWSAADEQVVDPDVVRTLGSNGLRLGIIRGGLPIEVEKVLNPPPPDQKVDVVTIDQPDGQPTDIDLTASAAPDSGDPAILAAGAEPTEAPAVTLLLNRAGATSGKDYQAARGRLRVVATRDGAAAGAVRVRLVPEVLHGPVRRGYAAATTGPFQPREFILKSGQAEDSFADLAATVSLRPGQALVIGSKGENPSNLGGFLFSKADPGSDRAQRRVVLIWARPGSALAPNLAKAQSGGGGVSRVMDRVQSATDYLGRLARSSPDAARAAAAATNTANARADALRAAAAASAAGSSKPNP